MKNQIVIALGAALLVSGCGGSGSSGASVPSQFIGTWGADCASPFVEFGKGTAKVFPDKATYQLKSAELKGSELSVSYDDASHNTLTDVYVAEGDTLRLDRTRSGAQEAKWNKAPMTKCS